MELRSLLRTSHDVDWIHLMLTHSHFSLSSAAFYKSKLTWMVINQFKSRKTVLDCNLLYQARVPIERLGRIFIMMIVERVFVDYRMSIYFPPSGAITYQDASGPSMHYNR